MKTQFEFDEEHAFEEEVQRVARELWPSCIHPGPSNIAGRECDGFYETEECIHLLKCTTSRRLDKAEKDIAKLDSVAELLRKQHRDKGVKTWFITKFDPTADQMKRVRQSISNVTALSLATFQERLIDVGTYLACRTKHRFGSVDHPVEGKSPNDIKYISIPILSANSHDEWSVEKIANSLLVGSSFTMLGDYGIGKSMTLREVFRYLRSKFLHKQTTKFPIYINLRESHGQDKPAEILERHARDVGYPSPSHLVRAWKAGKVVLILDGFDEVASSGLQIDWKEFRKVRSVVLTGVRKMISDSPSGCGIALAGRHSFFDSDKERNDALGDQRFEVLLLHEFLEEQVNEFLISVGFRGSIPAWLPARPLLLSTIYWMAVNRTTATDGDVLGHLPEDPSAGWELLLDVISGRESAIEVHVNRDTVRRLLEALATKVRTTPSGLGPLTTAQIIDTFHAISGAPPSPQALSVLQRLPGLGVVDPNSDNGQRSFLDEDLVDALGVGDVYRILVDPFSATGNEDILFVKKSLDNVGAGILRNRLSRTQPDRRRIVQTFREFERRKWRFGPSVDLFLFAHSVGFADQLQATFEDLEFSELNLSENDYNLSSVVLKSCVIRRLGISLKSNVHHLPKFCDCLIEHMEGVLAFTDLPANCFEKCSIQHLVNDAATNAAIFKADISKPMKVFLSVLRKLFVQSLSGRQENALKRGMDNEEQRFVSAVLDVLYREGMAHKYRTSNGLVVLPVRRMKRRVMGILASPLTSDDPVAIEFRVGVSAPS